MKKHIIVSIIILIVAYLSVSFINWDLTPFGEMSEHERGLTVVPVFAGNLINWVIYAAIKYDF